MLNEGFNLKNRRGGGGVGGGGGGDLEWCIKIMVYFFI